MFGLKKYKPADIASAHDKQKRKARGEGGIVFTEAEQAVLDENVRFEESNTEE